MPQRAPRILVVDDDEDDLILIRRALGRIGLPITLRVAYDSAGAIELLHAPDAPPPELVLLDVNLPQLGGHAVLRDVRAHASTRMLPVVMFSSSDHPKDVQASYENGANSHVRKPVSYPEFMRVMEGVVRYWLVLNEPAPR